MEIVKRIDMWELVDRSFDDWMLAWPFSRGFAEGWTRERSIRVDEFRDNGVLVVRADLPGIDPDEDVDISVTDGHLSIRAERREQDTKGGTGFLRKELRYGTFTRTLPLPAGADESDITATYRDGILEIRVPMAAPAPPPTTKVMVSKE